MSTQNALAQRLLSLQTPGQPLILTNIWDAITASTIASLHGTKALATASFAIAAAAGLADEDLDLDTNLRAVQAIARVTKKHDLPLTVDMQDGFGERLEEEIRRVIELGCVGCNLEDFGREVQGEGGQGKGGLYGIEEACERIKRVRKIAEELDVPDFVINARTDSYFAGPKAGLDEAITRGKAYLAAGASNIFIWGGPSRNGWGKGEVEKAVKALDGKLNVILVRMKKGGLGVEELREIGVARISVGPQLMIRSMARVKDEAEAILNGETV
ncbi:PEP phosphonomutase-like protein [Setomelanomma holmii]|uniref:PEP phosphonomutase-like protein n=1 Tax=Setomelanomma holmii TaxID=210430 RepID=A0A9P4HGP0_9PLEO|nr:PEP phosphonomutase-like protein [Setomelanomma holmii]